MKQLSFLCAMGLGLALTSGPMTDAAFAQVKPKLTLPKSLSEVGLPVLVVREIPGSDPRRRQLTCDFTCSAVRPRQSVVQVSWPELPASVDTASLRMDLSGTPRGLDGGTFGMVRLRAISEFRDGPTSEIDFETFRRDVQPVFLNTVVNNFVVARDPRLPSAQALIQLGDLDGVALTDASREALTLDRQSGSLGQVLFFLHGTDTKRTVLRRIVTGEGPQAGLSYRLRLVHEHDGVADVLGEKVCRVPVCPADYVK